MPDGAIDGVQNSSGSNIPGRVSKVIEAVGGHRPAVALASLDAHRVAGGKTGRPGASGV